MSASERARIKRATLAAQKALAALDAAGAEELGSIYAQAAESLRQAIQRHAGADGNVALEQLRSVLAQVENIVDNLAAVRNGVLDQGLVQAAREGAAAVILDTATSMSVATEALALARAFVAADGLTLSDRLWRLDRGAKEALTRAIELAVIQGHGSAQAARDFLLRGQAVPADVADRLGAGNATALGKTAAELMAGSGESSLYQAQRVFRTEINRAHGEAFFAGAQQGADVAGFRFLLSPNHPKHDICDLFATQNLYGLGPGVYPTRDKCPWPAHPNTLSYVEIVYKDEVSAADKAGKETTMQALERLPASVREGVLGKGKAEVYDAGKLRPGMIRSSLGAVRKRVG